MIFKQTTSTLLFILILFSSCINKKERIIADLETEHVKISIGNKGSLLGFIDLQSGKNYLSSDTTSILMAIRINNKVFPPHSAESEDDRITLHFINQIVAKIKTEEKKSHVSFELLSISKKDSVDLILWGPYHNTINNTIGETVGVVRGKEYAIGIQSLNIKTLGGYPWNESDRMPAFDIITSNDPNNMHPEKDGSVLYRVEAAKPSKEGSSLQAYCRNRMEGRIIADFNHEKIMAPAYHDGGVIGSKIALFGCPVEKTLDMLGEIEISEGLPHPMIDGEWAKQSPLAASAYLITNFTEDNVEEAIELTKKAGLKHLYHYGKTFENWGHFDLYKGEFPNGLQGLKRCVEKAEKQGVKIGTHFLSNFITTNDPYVTPVPDKRLAVVGGSFITKAITPEDTEIAIESPEFFNQMKNNNLRTVRIKNELIRYGGVSAESPWKLMDCQRGAFNTVPSEHQSGEEIVKLLDHGYKVFLTNADLTIEMSETMAEIYNTTGLRQISFDGLEGNRSTGLGTYGESLMPWVWYNSLDEDLKDHLIIDASRTTHFFWHIYTRMNWGEPWYGGFRESQTEYRFRNQAYFKRNFMPGMLGWFKMTPETSIEDAEWLLAKSAAYEAGYAFVANMDVIKKNGNADKILQLIGAWERLRLSDSFSQEQKERMKNTDNEFSLQKKGIDQWMLNQRHTKIYTHAMKEKQPGEPLYTVVNFNNTGEKQALNFTLTASNCDADNIVFEINNYKNISLPVGLKNGQILKYSGGDKVYIYNASWQLITDFAVHSSDFMLDNKEHALAIDCNFTQKGDDPHVKVEFSIIEKKENISLKKN